MFILFNLNAYTYLHLNILPMEESDSSVAPAGNRIAKKTFKSRNQY